MTERRAAARAFSRRRMLAVSALTLPVAAAASCGSPDLLAPPPGPSPSVRTLRASIAAEQWLVDAYHRVLAAYPALTVMLRPLLSQHHEHLAELKSRMIIPPHVKVTPLPAPSAPARPPASSHAAVTMLYEAEQGAAAAPLGRLATATPSLAQLLASIAASEATHAVALSGAPSGEGLFGNGTPGRAGAAGSAAVAALQPVLGAEDAAVYGYGLAGAQLSGGQLSVAQRDWTVHRAARETLSAMITQRGRMPRSAAVAYRPPFPVNSAGAARSLAAVLEEGVVRAYLGLVALDDQALRTFGALKMQEAAVRAASWRGSTTAFPGLPASALRTG